MNTGILFSLMETAQENGVPYLVHTSDRVLYYVILALCLIAAYLLGSLNSAVIVSRLFHGEDIRKFGSGNAGMTNIMRTYGRKEAGLTLLGDTMKMVLSLLLTGLLFGFRYAGAMSWNPCCYFAGLACMIGHIKPVFYGFKGGKGVLCFATMALILTPLPMLFILVCFFLIVLLSKYISLGSIVCAAFYPLVLQGYMQVILQSERFNGLIFLTTLAAAILLIYCHRGNIQRLLNHSENKFELKKKHKKNEETDNDEK